MAKERGPSMAGDRCGMADQMEVRGVHERR